MGGHRSQRWHHCTPPVDTTSICHRPAILYVLTAFPSEPCYSNDDGDARIEEAQINLAEYLRINIFVFYESWRWGLVVLMVVPRRTKTE